MSVKYLRCSDINSIINDHLGMERDFVFVVNKDLANYIQIFMNNIYRIRDVNAKISKNTKEFYLTLCFYDNDEIAFYVENAKCKNNIDYIISDLENCDYFIGTDMSTLVIPEKLLGKGCTWSIFQLIDKIDGTDCLDCDDWT